MKAKANERIMKTMSDNARIVKTHAIEEIEIKIKNEHFLVERRNTFFYFMIDEQNKIVRIEC